MSPKTERTLVQKTDTTQGVRKVTQGASPATLMAMGAYNTLIESKQEFVGVTRSDIFVNVQISLERARDKENEHRIQLAKDVQDAVKSLLSNTYTHKEEATAKLTLKVYVVLASNGTILNGLTRGMIGRSGEECLEWFLESADGSSIYKSGRVGCRDVCLKERNKALATTVANKLVSELVEQVGIPE